MNQLTKDPGFRRGLLLGLLIPLLVFALLNGLYYLLDQAELVSNAHFRPNFRLRTTALLGIAADALLLNRFKGRRQLPILRGVVVAISFYVLLWVIFFLKTVL